MFLDHLLYGMRRWNRSPLQFPQQRFLVHADFFFDLLMTFVEDIVFIVHPARFQSRIFSIIPLRFLANANTTLFFLLYNFCCSMVLSYRKECA